MTKTETVTKEYDEDGRLVKETTVTETTDETVSVVPQIVLPPVCTRPHYPAPVPYWQSPTYTSGNTGNPPPLRDYQVTCHN